MKKAIFFSCVVYYIFGTSALAATSPVVQVVSYKEPLGLYFSLQGWGSGSIVDNQGHIITNNHVVDDGVGGISDDFAICMTDNPSLPPRCHYTASVVSRDTDADVAVLQLDSTDIFGKKVDFEALSTLTMDMEYIPQSGDPVVARGYPWVGANTITETQGIISGTAQYNGNKYLKTDTLIAGGNSGGPLIRDDKIIGINTFLVGGGYDPSLGYSLLMSEAQGFIQEAFSQDDTLQSNNADFPQFLQKVEVFSSQKKIVDPLISINFLKNYTILSYIPATSFSASLADTDMTSVSSFSFYHMRIPKIQNTSELQKYLTSEMGVSKVVFSPITIGGKAFYELSFDENPESTKTNSTHIYLTVVDDIHLLFLYLETPVPTKKTLDSIQKSVKDFLSSVAFPSMFVFPEVADVTIPGTNISIASRGNAAISYDISEYRGLLAYSIENRQDFVMVRNYLGNFWSKAHIAVFKNSFATEDDSVDIWLKNVTEGAYMKPLVKKKVTYLGYEGFLICSEESIVDEVGKNNAVIRCEAVFFIGENNEYIVSSQMIVPKKQLQRIDILMVQYLARTLRVTGVGETNFHTQVTTVMLPYSDVGGQSRAFQEALSTLISYGVLQSRPVFEGDMPLRWKEYFSLFVWAVYHKKMSDTVDPNNSESPTFEKIFSVLPIVMDDYAEDDEWQLGSMSNLIRLLVAGGSLPKYDFETIDDFSNAPYNEKSVYKDAWDTITTFESTYFSRSAPMESAKYTSTKNITYNPFTDLDIQPKDTSKGMDFFRNNTKNKAEVDKILQCDKSSLSYFSVECRDMRKKSLLEFLTYPVLTKGRAIEIILGNINTSIWEPIVPKPE